MVAAVGAHRGGGVPPLGSNARRLLERKARSNARRLLERTARSNARCARTGVVTQPQVHDAVADGAVAIVRSCPIGDAAFVRSALGASV